MKSLLFALLVLFISFDCWADKESHARAKRYGATATFRLTVVDDQGKPVPNVEGSAGFWNHRTHKTDSFASTSNEKGEITLSGRCFYDGAFGLEKEGYYKTTGRHKFSRDSDDDVEETLFTRKWVPDYVSTVVLKKTRNPIPMYSKKCRGELPAINQAIGFDLKIVDWVKPYGKGENTDMLVTVVTKEVKFGRKTFTDASVVTFDFPGDYNGVQVCDSDGWSKFVSDYHVNLQTPFQKQLVMPSQNDRYKWLDKRKHLVFRVRSEVSPTGELLRCHYGKIYPTFDITSEEFALRAVFFNPTPNDTNLEFDPKRNLSPFKPLSMEERELNRLP